MVAIYVRIRIYLIKKSSAIASIKDACESPRLVLKWLDILDLDNQHVSRFRGFDIEGTGEVMYLGQVDITHVIGGVIIFDLSACPVHAFNLHNFSIFDIAMAWDWLHRNGRLEG